MAYAFIFEQIQVKNIHENFKFGPFYQKWWFLKS